MTSAQIARAAGVSLRQLQWWDEQGVARAVVDGHKRRYDEVDIFAVMIVAALRKRGFPLQQVRHALKRLKHGRPGEYAVWVAPKMGRKGIWFVDSDKEAAFTRALIHEGPVLIMRLPQIPSPTAFPQHRAQPNRVRTYPRTSFSTYGQSASL